MSLCLLEPAEERRHVPGTATDANAQAIGQDAGDVFSKAASRHVHQTLRFHQRGVSELLQRGYAVNQTKGKELGGSKVGNMNCPADIIP